MTLELSEAAYREIREKMEAAGYGHCFMPGGEIDMQGIAVKLGEDYEEDAVLEYGPILAPPGHPLRLVQDVGIERAVATFNSLPSRWGDEFEAGLVVTGDTIQVRMPSGRESFAAGEYEEWR